MYVRIRCERMFITEGSHLTCGKDKGLPFSSLPARRCSLKPNVPRQPGGQGAKNNTRPLAAGGTSLRNRGTSNGRPLWGTGVEDSHRSLCNPRRVGEGAYGTVSAIGHALLPTSLDGQTSGGQRGVAPLHSPPGCPWTR